MGEATDTGEPAKGGMVQGMDRFSARESEIFRVLRKLSGHKFVLIGGYAVNAYALPRFSVDCDLVVRKGEVPKIDKALQQLGYSKAQGGKRGAYWDFARYEHGLADGISASFDLLIDSVYDRQSGSTFSADWIFENSSRRRLAGKTISESISTRIINADALFVMKFVCARASDIRDVFMLCDKISDAAWVRAEISSKVDFKGQHSKIYAKVSDREFRKNLGGVFGHVDEKAFQKRLKLLRELCAAD